MTTMLRFCFFSPLRELLLIALKVWWSHSGKEKTSTLLPESYNVSSHRHFSIIPTEDLPLSYLKSTKLDGDELACWNNLHLQEIVIDDENVKYCLFNFIFITFGPQVYTSTLAAR